MNNYAPEAMYQQSLGYGAAGGSAGQMLMGQAFPENFQPTKKVNFSATEFRESLPEKKISLCGLVGIVLGPWLIFVIVFYARSMWLHYFYPWLSLGLALYFLVFVLVAGVMTFSSARDGKQGDPRVLGLVFLLCVIAWVTAWFAGEAIFKRFTEAYFDITNLNDYPSVDPSKFRGSQLMDAGMVEFSKKAKLDFAKSVGFKDGDMYCVVPITMGSMKHYDFWAVGTNCCGTRPTDANGQSTYHCGEYNIPGVHKGLRLMNDDQRKFFRLAVKEAEAAYDIEASHPVFLHWLSDPAGEADAYQDDANWYFMFGVFGFFAVLLFVSVCFGFIMHLGIKT